MIRCIALALGLGPIALLGGCLGKSPAGASAHLVKPVITVEGLEFVAIEPGGVRIRSGKNVAPEARREIVIHHRYYICRTEVTNDAYARFDPAHRPDVDSPTGAHPAISISWDDAREFCRWLAARAGMVCRLPSEAEWEYAARAGSETVFCHGNGVRRLDEFAWSRENSGFECHPVARLRPNAWGLYDVHGNVWEWCEDRCGYLEDDEGQAGDHAAEDALPFRVLKGGCWRLGAIECRLSGHMGYLPHVRYGDVGFRPVLVSPPDDPGHPVSGPPSR